MPSVTTGWRSGRAAGDRRPSLTHHSGIDGMGSSRRRREIVFWHGSDNGNWTLRVT